MAGERTRPNILLLVADQHRGDCLGIEGQPVLQTPHLDAIGGTGAHFRRAYSEAPTCIPARRTLMSGQAPAAHGMVGMVGGVAWDPPHTLAGELTRAGYQTELIGKLHLYPPRKRYGFERMQLADSTRGGHNDYLRWLDGALPKDRWAMAHGATPNGWIGRPSHLPEAQTHAFWCASRAIEFLETRDPEAPFFLNVSFIDPHPPFTPPQFFYDRYVAKGLPEPVIGDWAPVFEHATKGIDPEVMLNRRARLDPDTLHYCRAAYYGLVNHVDSQVGRILQYARDARLLENTVVLYTADHGEMLGDHHMFSKARAFEPSARVPFLVRAPRAMGLPAGVQVDQPVGLQDVMPTLLDAAGVPVPVSCTGQSVLPLIRGRAAGWRSHLHGEHSKRYSEEESMHYLVDGKMKYIWYSQTGAELLFDLEADPQERHDLLRDADAAARVAPWRARLADALRDRPEGFVEGERLVPGRPHEYLVPGRNVANAADGHGARRRDVLIGGALLGASGVLAACQMPGEPAAPRMDAREVTLTYLTDWTSGARGEWVKQAMPRFTQEFPKIKVQVENATGSLQTVLLASAAGGTIQDVFNNENDVFQKLAQQGDMRDIAPVLKSLRVNPGDVVSIPSGYTYGGKQYGLPLQLSLATMMLNKTLFRQNGVALPDKNTTYPQWVEMLRKVSRPADGVWGFLTNGTPGGWGQWMPFVWSYGGDRWSNDLKKCLFDQPASIEGLQLYADLANRMEVAPPLNAQGAPVPQGLSFQNGNVACAIATSPGANVEQQVAGKFEWDVMSNPLGPRTNKRFQTTNTNAICVSANAPKRNVFDQAVQLVAWSAASKTAQDLVVETGASTPVYKPVLNGPKFLAGPPASQKLVTDSLPDWKDPQIFIGWIEFRDTVVGALVPALANQKSIPDAAREMTRLGQLVLDKIPR